MWYVTFILSTFLTQKAAHIQPLRICTNKLQNAGEAKKDKATLEHEASHATAKLPGGISASSSGAVTKDDPNRQEGAWNQTIGSAKETVGNLVGSEVSIFHFIFKPSY